MNNKNSRHSICFPKFTPKGATSPLREDSRDDAQEPLCSSPKGDWARSPLKPEVTYYAMLLYKLPVVHTHDAPRATPNRLEASFKSNKRESTGEDASSALEMGVAAHTSQMLKLTLKSCSHPSPSLN